CLALLVFTFFTTRRRKNKLESFVAPKLLAGLTSNVSRSHRRVKNILCILGIAFLFLALARPQYGERWIEVRRKGIDILIGVDVSKSMLAQDIKPSRLERAKLAIRDFVVKLEGDRVGLLPFAGTAFLMCPLTTDYEAFNASLTTLDAESIPKGGTDLGLAIRQGGEVLSNETNHKILVLVTDGEDLSEDALRAAEKAKEQNMTVYTIGVGTPEGELIPASQGQKGRFIQDAQGKFITSKLDEQTLTALAETTGGLYVPLGNMGQGFDTIYEQKLALVPEEEHGQRRRKIPIERFPWPLGVAVLLLSVDFLITGRRSSRSLSLPFVKTAGRRRKRVALTVFFIGTISGLSNFITPQAQASQGEELFKAGDYAGAEAYYQQSLEKENTDPALYFNLGGSLYRQQKYDQAATAFTQALSTDDLSLQAQSYYNRGNSQFFLGMASAAEDKEETLKQWNAAKKSFEAALQLEPEDKAAAHNLEMVSKKLDQLKEEMRQSGQQCDNPHEGENGDQQQDQQKDQEKDQEKKRQDEQGKQNNSQPEQGDQQTQQPSDQEKQEEQEKQEGQSNSAGEQEADTQEQEKHPGAEQEQEENQE
ncbi:MAG: VWA domain-containing protein, partial [Candidatus Electrothrix sp. MAN1_4]|nr:VWA domain-containing protein [Candidatus Electrothrix sp. MAN1_4]